MSCDILGSRKIGKPFYIKRKTKTYFIPQLLPLTAFSTFYGILQLNTQSIEITGFLYLRFAAFYTFQSIQIRVSPSARRKRHIACDDFLCFRIKKSSCAHSASPRFRTGFAAQPVAAFPPYGCFAGFRFWLGNENIRNEATRRKERTCFLQVLSFFLVSYHKSPQLNWG